MKIKLLFGLVFLALANMSITACPIILDKAMQEEIRTSLRKEMYENLEMVQESFMEKCVVSILKKTEDLLRDIKAKHNDKAQVVALLEKAEDQKSELEHQKRFLVSLPQELPVLPIGCTALEYMLSKPLCVFPTAPESLMVLIDDLISVTWYADGLIKDAKMYSKEDVERVIELAKARLVEVDCMLIVLEQSIQLLQKMQQA